MQLLQFHALVQGTVEFDSIVCKSLTGQASLLGVDCPIIIRKRQLHIKSSVVQEIVYLRYTIPCVAQKVIARS